jgi:predicted TIM-barrel fold metal-dependent hydrolase
VSNPVGSVGSTIHWPINPAWLDRLHEDILEPDIPIIDAHHHLMDRPQYHYLLPEFLADVSTGHNIRATIFVQASAMYRADGPVELRTVGETEFVNGCAAMSASGLYGPARACAGIVGHVDLLLGDRAKPVLEAHIAAGNGRFRGIRHSAARDPSPEVRTTSAIPPEGLMADPAFRRGFSALGQLGLSFDAWVYHPQVHEVLDLARAFPGTTIILDHLGGPAGVGPYSERRAEVFATWKASLSELARCENVFVKMGGLAMRLSGFDFPARELPPSSEALATSFRPYVETAVELFDPGRCMFESNFPIDKGGCSYPVLWNAFKRIVACASLEDKRAMFFGAAARAYRINL